MAAPSRYNQEIHDKWAWSLAIRGATDKEIAEAFGVTERTINRWKYKTDEKGNPYTDERGEKILSSFGKILQTGKSVADAEVEYSLYRRATGYRTTDVEKIVDIDKKTGAQTVSRTRIIEKEVQPDSMAIMYWLNNRSRKTGDWSNRREEQVMVSSSDYSLIDGVAEKLKGRATNEPEQT